MVITQQSWACRACPDTHILLYTHTPFTSAPNFAHPSVLSPHHLPLGGTTSKSPERSYQGDIREPGLTNFFFCKSLPLLSAESFSLSFMAPCQPLDWAFLFLKRRKREKWLDRHWLSQMRNPGEEALVRTPGWRAQLPQSPGHLRSSLACFSIYKTVGLDNCCVFPPLPHR